MRESERISHSRIEGTKHTEDTVCTEELGTKLKYISVFSVHLSVAFVFRLSILLLRNVFFDGTRDDDTILATQLGLSGQREQFSERAAIYALEFLREVVGKGGAAIS
jgi:hypothetical protein